MFQTQINNLPETTELKPSTIFAVENSNVTSKMTYGTFRGDGFVKVVAKLVTFGVGVGTMQIEADNVSGYTFVCWLGAFCTGGANTYTIVDGSGGTSAPFASPAVMYRPGSTTGSALSYVVTALYVKN